MKHDRSGSRWSVAPVSATARPPVVRGAAIGEAASCVRRLGREARRLEEEVETAWERADTEDKEETTQT